MADPETIPAEEKTVWEGRSSQWTNFVPFLLCLLVVFIPWAIWRYLAVRCSQYRLTTQRLLITTGVFSRKTETLELYRVRDLQLTQPFLLRMVGLENVGLTTSDMSTPSVFIRAVPTSAGLGDLLRKHVEECRVAKRVREIDVE